MRVKLPWWAIINILTKQIRKMAEDIERDREDGKITRSEWENLLAENLLEVIPELVEAIVSSRG
jgi:hypothetical protein